MNRRQFLEVTAGALGAATLGACALDRRLHVPQAVPTSPIDAAAFHAARRFAKTPMGRIAYVERGTGPAALFLHGYPLNGFQWRGALERLSKHRRCIAPDSMGLGYSEVPEAQSVAPDAQVEMFVALLDRLAIPAVDLVGNDSGGAISQLLVARHPNRVRTLLLTNCDAHDDSPPPSFLPFIAAARTGALAAGISRQLADKALARSPKGIGGLTYTEPANPTDDAIDCYFTPLVSSPLRKAQFQAYAIALEHNPLAGTETALASFTGPVRIVWGTADTIFDQASADWLDHLFPHSQGVRRVPGAKLFFPEEMPDLVAEEARRLWQV